MLHLLLILLQIPIQVCGLKTEHLKEPIGIDNSNPRFSWHLEDNRSGANQTAFRIIVSNNPEDFSSPVWDSGRIVSDAPTVTYSGLPLQPMTKYWWKVCCMDMDGLPHESKVSIFETGKMAQSNWHGSWISDNNDIHHQPAPRFRKEFKVCGSIESARAYIATAGLYTLLINGRKVGDHVLDPAFTRFDRRVLYSTYDITPYIKDGGNAVGVELGNGWYNHQAIATWGFDKAPWRSRPTFCMDIHIVYSDGSDDWISSDSGWATSSEGPVIYNNIYTGEHYDARRVQDGWAEAGYDEGDWDKSILRSCPASIVSSQQMVPITENPETEAVKIIQLRPNRWVYDFGYNTAGNVHLRIKGPRGTVVTLKYAERLSVENRADQSNIDYYYFGDRKVEPFQTDKIILSGGEDSFSPSYSYKGFRYVEVNSSSPLDMGKDNLKAVSSHSAVPEAGVLTSSSKLVNAIWEAARRTYLSNLQGYPTDCPQREKNGWTGDAHIAVETGLYNYDAFTIYEKWLADHRDEQQPNGVLPDIIPTCGWGYASPSSNGNGLDWTSTIALIPWELYLFYGDDKPLRDNYSNIRRYVDYALTLTKDGLCSWGRGDWVPVTTRSNKTLVCSCFLYKDLCILSRAARMFGFQEDEIKYSAVAEEVRNAINAKYLDPASGIYAEGMQTDQSLPLVFGLVPDEAKAKVVEALVKKVEADDYHVNAGVHGAKAVLNALSENERGDIAYRIASAVDYPSWGWWIANGRTTLIENWRLDASRDNSDNHIMFGDVAAWFHRSLGGINPDPEQPGFKHIILRPVFPRGLDRFECSHNSPYGEIISKWERKGRKIRYTAVIPCGCSATLTKPDGSTVELPSGTYSF